MDNDKENKKVLAYIERQHSILINKENTYENNYDAIKPYLVNYEDVNLLKLREIFAYFHVTLNQVVKDYTNANSSYISDEDYAYLEDSIRQTFLNISDIQRNLQRTQYSFNMKEPYNQYLIGNHYKYDKLQVVEIEPIFELFNFYGFQLFQDVIERFYDKNWDLGKIFQSKVQYKCLQDNVLTWETMVSDEERLLLKNNWKYIEETINQVFGAKIQVKNIPVKNIDLEYNRKVNKVVKRSKVSNKQKFSKISDVKINKDFQDTGYKNILLKGVPGTGKSRTIDHIIKSQLNLGKHLDSHVLRINIHSASSNADLMQGIGISSNEKGEIEYKERQGLIFEFIEKATFNPNQPFALVLEEIQENSLNELIGDLIYLIEESKRAKGLNPDNKEYTYRELVEKILKDTPATEKVKMPNLINQDSKAKVMIIPDNLFVFCTSNYRDDRRVIEDNLLRRFDVIEVYPKYKRDIEEDFKSSEVSDFLEKLNKSIVEVCSNNGEIHPDRFMIGHSIWLNVEERKAFSRSLLKVITEFKDIKDMHFDDFQRIIQDLEFPFEMNKEHNSYEEWIKSLQSECYDFLG